MHGKRRKNGKKEVKQRLKICDYAYKNLCLENAHIHFLASLAFIDMACLMKTNNLVYTNLWEHFGWSPSLQCSL